MIIAVVFLMADGSGGRREDGQLGTVARDYKQLRSECAQASDSSEEMGGCDRFPAVWWRKPEVLLPETELWIDAWAFLESLLRSKVRTH